MAKEKKEAIAAKAESLLEATLESIQNDYGEGIISYGRDDMKEVEVIPFSIPSLNRISGIGGIPKGRITEFHGMDGTFKTTFALDLASECQKQGGTCAILNAEYSYSAKYAASLGVDIDRMIVVNPASAEEAYTLLDKLVDTGEVDLIIIDSTTSLSPTAEIENDFGSSNMGVMARLNGQFFRKITAKIGKTNTALVIINQLRENIGGYGPLKVVPGGNAIKFFASMRFEIGKAAIKVGDVIKGVTLTVKCVKNKLGTPFLETEIEAIFGKGINKMKDVLKEGMLLGIIEKGGAGWLTYKGQKVQGIDNFIVLLRDNDELREEILGLINDAIYGTHTGAA